MKQNQITKEYYKDYLQATEAMFVQPRKVEILERLGLRYGSQ